MMYMTSAGTTLRFAVVLVQLVALSACGTAERTIDSPKVHAAAASEGGVPASVRPPSDLLYKRDDEIGILDASGHSRTLSPGKPSPKDHPDWSPDGKRVVFDSDFGSLWVVGADGSGLRRIKSCNEPCSAMYDPAWSSDGRSIAFAVAETQDGEHTARAVIKVLNLATSRTREVYADTSHHDWIFQPRWSPHGDSLVFEQDTFASNRLDEETVKSSRIGVVALRHHHGPTFIAAAQGQGAQTPDWGRRAIVFSAQGNLVTIDADGRHRRRVTSFDDVQEHAIQPTFSPGGDRIVFTYVKGQFGVDDLPAAAIVSAHGGPHALIAGGEGLTHPRLKP